MHIVRTPIRNLYMFVPEGSTVYPNTISIMYNGEEKFIIDLGSPLEEMNHTLKKLNLNISKIDIVILTHFHPDHSKSAWRLASIPDAPEIWLNEIESKSVKTWDAFFELYGLVSDGDLRNEWIRYVGEPLDSKPFEADKEIRWGGRKTVGGLEIEFIGTPGHTPGHTSIKINDLIILGDIDLTKFPWYGHPKSSLEDFIESTLKLKEMNPKHVISMHRGLISENIDKEFDNYLKIIELRDKKLLKEIDNVNSLGELVNRGIIYPKVDARLRMFFEIEMLKKHIFRLVKLGKLHESVLEKLKLDIKNFN
ncbi:MAG: MBL fold metallo-hydrolase [Candidatus Njordarchaeia archaeon]